MASSWQTTPVREITTRITKGTTPTTGGGAFAQKGIAFIKVESITEAGNILPEKLAFIDEATHQVLSRSIIQADDVLFTIAGTIGRTALIRAEHLPANTNQAVAIVRPDKGKVLPRFLYYALSDKEKVQQANSRTVQSVQANFSLGELGSLEVDLPSMAEQRSIASALGALDDKIELNRRMNATLEAMAQAVFKEWFVDGAKEKWEEKPLRELFTISKASVDPGDFPEEVFDHYSIPAFDEGRVPKPELGGTIKSNKFTVPERCVLLSKLNPRFPRVWVPDLRNVNRPITSTEFIVVRPKQEAAREFLYGLFTSQLFSGVFENMATGSTGSHQRVRPETLLGMTTSVPDEGAVLSFSKLVRPMLERCAANINETQTLAALRDTLLPKLMRGEVRVKGVLGHQVLKTH